MKAPERGRPAIGPEEGIEGDFSRAGSLDDSVAGQIGPESDEWLDDAKEG